MHFQAFFRICSRYDRPRRSLFAGLCILLVMALPVWAQMTSEEIQVLKQEAVEKGWTFTVGENAATGRPVEQLAGLVITPEDLAEAEKKVVTPRMEDKALPARWDWREHVSAPYPPIKDQGSCGSCWAFATTGAFEWVIKVVDGDTVSLSEQWLLGCNTDAFYNDCDGGFFAHNYHKDKADECGQSGAVLEADCPYLERMTSVGALISTTTGFRTGPTWEPFSPRPNGGHQGGDLCLWAGFYVKMSKSFVAYTGGVYNDRDSEKIDLTDHALVIIGWDDSTVPTARGS